METNTNNTQTTEAPKRSSKGFIIVLAAIVVVGGWFAYSKITHAKHHIETDDAQVEANIPHTTIEDSIPFYLYDKKKQDRYRLWTNSKTVSYNYGGTLGITWNMPKISGFMEM